MNWTVDSSNPCNYNTWIYDRTYYEGNVVLIQYDDFFGGVSCTVQQWTWMFEQYGAVGVLIANNKDSTHVYALPGDYSLVTSIPTRMISEYAGNTIIYSIGIYNDEIYADFGCYEHTEFPSLVCLTDYSNYGQYVYLDGEYQRQLLPINDHPYYLKSGHYGLFEHLFIWLDIDRSVSGEDSWRWVIGSNFNDINSVVAECKDNGEHIDHPGLCGNKWYINDTLRATITVSNDSCVLSDNYVCVDSAANTWFEHWFDGMYRQIHDGVSLWLYVHDTVDSYITVGQVAFPPFITEPTWAFAITMNQTDVYAFCVIGDGKTQPTTEQMMKPYECTDDWHVVGLDPQGAYTWYIDLAFDIDECTHPNISTTATVIDYPTALCLADPTNTYSHYQSQYGVYILDTNTTYDGKYIYYNQRLKDNHDEWYMLWYEEKDAWVINQMIPGYTVVANLDGICRSDVDTPDQCSACWEFYEGFKYEKNCDIAIHATTSLTETDCMHIPTKPVNMVSTERISLCFDDGYSSEWSNAYTAVWYKEDWLEYGGRDYWYTLAENGVDKEYFMFYDPTWRFWVIDSRLGNIEDNWWHWYCLKWDEFEPFNCDTWYSRNYNWTMTMNTTCYSDSPTKTPTASPTTSMPTRYPTTQCNARNAFVYADWTHPGLLGRVLTSTYTNFAPFSYDTIHKIPLIRFENGRNMTETMSNPCIMSTWQENYLYYNGKVVMIELNDLCHMERQVLNLEFMGAEAVLIQNNADWTHVYALAGDDTLYAFPTIPTRMISQLDGIYPLDYVMEDGHEVYISIDCYDDTIEFPSIICLVDMSSEGKRVYLDGEYQRQSSWWTINDHPIWYKAGKEGLWQDIYMWLMIETENGNDAWKWVIGTKYWDDASIIAICDVNGTHIEHPALCGRNWYVNDTLEATIVTNDTECHLGDSYFCVDANPGGIFDVYFDGQYRQIHDGVAVWIHEDPYTDMYIAATTMTFPDIGLYDAVWAFAFIINQTQTWAFCIIGDGSYPSDIDRLSPHECAHENDWYVMEFDYNTAHYYWVIDYAFDIDECVHPDISTTEMPAIDYPKSLCLNDPSGGLTFFQGHYGIYNLVNYNETNNGYFDGRRIYENQRLKDPVDNNIEDEWYIMWYEEKDAWVINQLVPNQWVTTVVRDHEGICREDVLTPDLCKECWQFYYHTGMMSEMNCAVQLTVIDSQNEADCMMLPTATPREELFEQQSVGFFDGKVLMIDNEYSGEYKMGDAYYGDRPFYHKVGKTEHQSSFFITYYIWYDEYYRYWVLDDVLGSTDHSEWELVCWDWMSWEPWNCEMWHVPNSIDIVQMSTTYEYPEIICLVDMSSNGKRVYLDGEYQRLSAWLSVNDKALYHKDGYDGLWKDIWIWWGSQSKWVIGTKYWDEYSVIAICNKADIENPALCGRNWWVNNTLEATIVTNDTECHLGDSYFCVDANPGGVFDVYFTGQYRQIHDGVAVWVHEDDVTDMYIAATTMTFPHIGLHNEFWAFAFIINQTQTWAFCIIGDGSYPNDIDRLSPHDCGQHNDWYVMEFDYNTAHYYWVIDYAFDVDECTHPDISTTAAPAIEYPKSLCLNDASGAQTLYQGHYGIYNLVNYNETNHGYFDGRRIYENQRLKDVWYNNIEDEWYIMWFEEKDAWVINQIVPDQWTTTVVRDHEGICREDVLTPDLCTECWQFYYLTGLRTEIDCNVQLTVIDSKDEADCMTLPTPTPREELLEQQSCGFFDGDQPSIDNEYSGEYQMGEHYYGDRPFYHKVEKTEHQSSFFITYYIWFDETYRYWVLDDVLGSTDYSQWSLICLDWMSWEPWNCDMWHVPNDIAIVQMSTNYEFPAVICLVDMSSNGKRVYLDGEYERLGAWLMHNNAPLYHKDGHEGLWKDIWIWWNSQSKWVIGTKYWDETSIIAICDGVGVENPALCGRNWWVNNTLETSIVTNDTECHLGDSYFCVDANPGGLFDVWFDGQYRQVHDGVAVWIHEDEFTDMYIAATTMTFPHIGLYEQFWAFAFIINQSETWAFCIIGDGTEPEDIDKLSPHDCGKYNDWYVMEFDYATQQYYWVIDYAFDVDECTHPDISTTEAPAIQYPKSLCLNDPTGALSHYQGHYGIYTLVDYNETNHGYFDGRRIYENQRLKDVVDNYIEDEWYIMWYEEKDSWVINQLVPNQWTTTVVRNHEGICREDVSTPDLCNECWQFYYLTGLRTDTNCNVKLTVIDSRDESDCMTMPEVIPRDELSEERSVDFLYQDSANNSWSGTYVMGEDYHGNRPYYHQYISSSNRRLMSGSNATVYYIWFDETYRYWVLNDKFTADYSEWSLFCLDWISYEPWNCVNWHIPNSMETVQMSASPNMSDAAHAKDSDRPWLLWLVGGICVMSCCIVCMMLFKKRKNRMKKEYDFDHRGSHSAVHLGTPPEDKIDISMVQMGGSPNSIRTPGSAGSGAGTSAVGETSTPHLASQESGSSGNNNDSFNGIDGLDGDHDGTGRMARNSKSKSGSGSGSSSNNPEKPLRDRESIDRQFVARRSTTGTAIGDLDIMDLHESGDDDEAMYGDKTKKPTVKGSNNVNPFDEDSDVQQHEDMLRVGSMEAKANWVKFEE